MTTYKDLVDETLHTLHGVVGDLEQLTELDSPLDTSTLTFSVDDAQQVSRGLIEIGDELMWVKSTNQASNTVTLASFGRGFRQTSAASHSVGDMITNTPLFPRVLVKAALQEVANSLHPSLYAVRTDESNTANGATVTYPVPADASWVIRVEWQAPGSSGEWVPVRRYKLDTTADTTAFSTGKSIDIYDGVTPGRTIKVTYAGVPLILADDTDTLDDIGLEESTRDLFVYGACSRLLMGVEAGRLNLSSVEQSDRDTYVLAGAAQNAAKTFFSLYELRLAAERLRLQQLYPTTTYVTR